MKESGDSNDVGIELKMAKTRRSGKIEDYADDLGKDTSLNVVDGRLSIHFSDQSTLIRADELPEFIEMVKNDNVTLFRAWPVEKQQLYIKGKFDYRACDSSHHSHGKIFELPFNLAAGFCAVKLVKEFLHRGADITRPDGHGCNILHVLVVASSERRDFEEDYVHITDTLLDVMTPFTLMQLCTQENERGYRPLELAALLGSFAVYNSLIQKRGYICGEPRMMGLSTIHPYDISDYEPGGGMDRLIRSPLKLLCFVDRNGFDSMKKFKTLQLPIIQQWTRHQMKSCFPFLLIWWIYRLVFLGATSYLDPSFMLFSAQCGNPPKKFDPKDPVSKMGFDKCQNLGNFSAEYVKVGTQLNQAVMSWSCFMLAVDVLEIIICLSITDRRRAYLPMYFRDCTSFTISYRLAMFILYMVAVVGPQVGKMHTGGDAFQNLLFVKAFQLPLCLYSFLYMIEFMPIVGIFAITIQRMMKSMAIFLAFLLPVKIIFSQFFTFFAADDGFTGLGIGVYLLFLLDMGSFDFGTSPTIVIKIVHVFYFLVMIILLFNYLIAVLSIVADETAEDRQQLMQLRRLQMMAEVEERLVYWCRLLVRKVRGKNKRTILVA